MAREVRTSERIYTVVDDVRHRLSVFVAGTARDALSGEPLRARLSVGVIPDGFYVRTFAGGLFCVAARSTQALLDLATSALTLPLTLSAPGYRPRTTAAYLPAGASLPIILPDTLMFPLPVIIDGRVVEDTTARLPIVGASVSLVDDPAPPMGVTPAHVAMLRGPLHLDHAPGTPVRVRAPGAPGLTRHLTAPSLSGQRTLSLSSRAGLNPGDILSVGSGNQLEYSPIESIAAFPANPALPGQITLVYGFHGGYPLLTALTVIPFGAPTLTRQLDQPAVRDEGLLQLDNPLPAGTAAVEVADADPARREFHALGVLTDADGFYRLRGVAGLTTVFIQARSGPASDTQRWAVNTHSPANNTVNFRL